MRYVDANVIIDALIDQGTGTHGRSLQFLDAVTRGRETVATTELALAEVIWALKSARGGRLSGTSIRALLTPFINAEGVLVPNKALWQRVLDLLVTLRLDVPDIYLLALLEGEASPEIYSYDTDFDRLPGVKRLEP